MTNPNQQITQEIIQHKITKVNGQVGFKRYIKGQLLGKGGFAKCYSGISIETQKKYAIKVVEKCSLQKNRSKQKLLSQIKIHKTLHHKYIVEFDSVFQDTKNVYIILELCPNKTLSEMVKRRKKLTVKEVKFFMQQLISGLQYMHSNRVIHRDLKMGNIFLGANMEMKIGDFGLAAKLQFIEQKKRTMCGTPNYIAPQIVQGAVGHSYEVDIWSTGVICYALLYGRPPFQTNQVKTTYKKIKNCQYTFPNISVPDQAKDFIKRILILDPKQRMTVKQMKEHPFLNSDDIPRSLSVQALISIPSFKNINNNFSEEKRSLSPRLRPEDFNKKKLPLTEIINQQGVNLFQGMLSPRSAFNEQPCIKSTLQKNYEHNINVITYVDYSTKYGLGYLINNKHYGVYFNDSSLMSTNESKSIVYYIQNPSGKDEKILIYKAQQLPTERNFQKKYLLLERFITHLDQQLVKTEKQKKQKGLTIKYEKDQNFAYMKQWLKTKHAIMFRLNNKLFQVDFFDGSQILLNTDKKTVLFTGKKGNIIYQTLVAALQAKDTQLARRIKYTKQILNSIKKGKQGEKNQNIE